MEEKITFIVDVKTKNSVCLGRDKKQLLSEENEIVVVWKVMKTVVF